MDNKAIIILDCDSCHVPMAVWKEHTMKIDNMDESIMRGMLVDVANEYYNGEFYYIDTVQNEIFDHLHWHARKKIKKSEKRA